MFAEWHDFYLLVGSAAGALIGLLFVVVTLTTGANVERTTRGIALYMTPTVFHFAIVVVISALTMTPLLAIDTLGALLGAIALAGLIYQATKAHGIRTTGTSAHWTDFWFYGAAPVAWYLALAIVAVEVWRGMPDAPYWLGALAVALLILGIRNAWDLVSWMAPRVDEMKKPDAKIDV